MKLKLFWITVLLTSFSFTLASCAKTGENTSRSHDITVVETPSSPPSPSPSPLATASANTNTAATEMAEETDEVPSIDDEAAAFAKKVSPKIVKQCGEYYYVVTSFQGGQLFLYQIREEPSVYASGTAIPPRELSEADRLNGVNPQPMEWEGALVVEFGTNRGMWGEVKNKKYVFDGNWTQWKNGVKFQPNLRKVNGQWRTYRPNGETPAAFECSELPIN